METAYFIGAVMKKAGAAMRPPLPDEDKQKKQYQKIVNGNAGVKG